MKMRFAMNAFLAVATLGLVATADAAELNPNAVAYITPDKFKWRDPSHNSPNNQTILYGDPTKPGPYLYINTGKAGRFSPPHFHPNDRFIIVLKGPWWVGSGPVRDPAKAVAMPVGTFVTHFGKQVHWDGTKEHDSAVLIFGEGPATNIPATDVPPPGATFDGLDPKAVTYLAPDKFRWRDPLGTSPVDSTRLLGDASKPGLYLTLVRYKPGGYSRPHFHSGQAHIMVLKGTFWVGTGTKFLPDNMMAMPTGTYNTHFANQVHYQGARDEEAIVMLAGQGPSVSTPAEEK